MPPSAIPADSLSPRSPSATDDRMIPPQAQRQMAERAGATTTELPGSHAIYVSQPAAVASLIIQAARSPRAATSVA
jgi:pimeloyl-ACP methyl ester carboxylesterase